MDAVTVAILTRDRPGKLAAALVSHLESARRFGHTGRLLVLDDSPDSSTRQANEIACQLSAEQVPGGTLAVHYVSPGAKEEYAHALASRTGVPLAVARFAVCGYPGFPFLAGANTNAFLLLTAGKRALCFDDDVTCMLAAPASPSTEWAQSSAADPTEFTFFRSQEDAFATAAWDPGADIHGLLREPLGQLVTEFGQPRGSLADPTTEKETSTKGRNRACEDARVAVSTVGVRGDSGMGFPAYLLKLREPSRARLLGRGENDFLAHLASRQVARGVRAPTFSEPTYFQSYAFGTDGTALLPPCLPVFRGQDTLWAATLRVCQPGSLLYHAPWQIRHEPPPGRRVPLEHFAAEAGQTHLAHWLRAVLGMFAQSTAGCSRLAPAASVSALGSMLQGFAQLPRDRALAAMGEWVRRQHEAESKALDGLLQAYSGQPVPWARQVEAYRSAIIRTLQSPNLVHPVLPAFSQLAEADASALAMRLLADFGALLEAWPALYQSALDAPLPVMSTT